MYILGQILRRILVSLRFRFRLEKYCRMLFKVHFCYRDCDYENWHPRVEKRVCDFLATICCSLDDWPSFLFFTPHIQASPFRLILGLLQVYTCDYYQAFSKLYRFNCRPLGVNNLDIKFAIKTKHLVNDSVLKSLLCASWRSWRFPPFTLGLLLLLRLTGNFWGMILCGIRDCLMAKFFDDRYHIYWTLF